MTAKDYLKSQLSDPWPEATSVQTRTALAAYAMRMQRGVNGYSIPDAEKLIRSCNLNEDFIDACTDFLSDTTNFMQLLSRIPELDD